jgi:hypothetical protein
MAYIYVGLYPYTYYEAYISGLYVLSSCRFRFEHLQICTVADLHNLHGFVSASDFLYLIKLQIVFRAGGWEGLTWPTARHTRT